ncbi:MULTISPECIES: CDP-alcohol phosphatidyltransferase family protein [unclassified Arthrobacter]|uniref:CDP-alcohol phosphatidyltransferase family protein n=1 Tax=unclassified Arthrobacter TaxID=235627 RepID=UPI0021058386|nr:MULTISPECIES: CDP-alcohol phosphatidyltransferase family protein [unclassified Arthrobacter]MCQ1947843.1 CDP-alcohol phosphatidyltransferase family protein [Arthrobacter sp. zg-Y1116]MCQ1987782.1 CDP-alcohol phosphatidyltransferase family protein [Arthrobacter sp. zg-Y844]MCQ1996253.1 CDP-alcohol phosphatidyltransferase family protein [Arthrobacter sp. zg-Y1171]UWX82696.1 CDP-alcohol phosphatidyltransferase family protein [Arthrobacter sp. zg-Y1171]
MSGPLPLPQAPDRPGFRASFDQLRQAQKTRKGAPLYLLYVNRPAGRAVAAALRGTRIAPNHVTWAGAVLTYGSLVWLALWAQPEPAAALAGVLLAAGYVLDSADGQLARLQGSSTAYGEWLDHLLDNGRITVMHVAAFCFLARTTDYDVVLLALACGVFLLASSVIFFGGMLFDQLARNARTDRGPGHGPDGCSGQVAGANPNADRRLFVRSVVMLPADYGITCLAFLALPAPSVFLTVYLILAAAHVVLGAAFVRHWRSKLLRLR